jgi:lysophospholipase L1-like esterase
VRLVVIIARFGRCKKHDHHVLIFLAATICCASVRAADGANRWDEAIRKFEEQDAAKPPAPGGVVFVGSSSIRMWDLKKSFPDLAAVNRGFGGSQLADAVHFAHRIVTPYKPRLVVLYAGDNDIAAGKSPEQVVADFRRFVKTVREKSPEARIAYIAIKPSLKRWSLVEKMREANRQIAAIAERDERLHFVDIDAPMIGEDRMPRPELYARDGLHLSEEGYQVWSERLRPVLIP